MSQEMNMQPVLPIVVPHEGPKDAVVAFVGASPSVIDTIRQRPFCGPGGETLRELYLKALGVERDQVLLMNLVPDLLRDERGKAREPTDDEVNEYSSYVIATLTEYNPQFIIALGRVAKRALNHVADTWLPHPLAVRLHGDTGEVSRKLKRIKTAMAREPDAEPTRLFYWDEEDPPSEEFLNIIRNEGMRTEGTYRFPWQAYAYVGDRSDPETFRFRLWESPTRRVTAEQVQKACEEYRAADEKPFGVREVLLLHWGNAGLELDEFPIEESKSIYAGSDSFTIRWKGSSETTWGEYATNTSASEPSDWTYTANTVLKVDDDEKRLVYGIVMEPGTFDSHMDFTSPQEIEQAAHQYLINSRVVGEQHAQAAQADVVESFIAPTDITFGDEVVREGSWLMGVRVNDDDLWAGVKDGRFTGFSIGGFATRE